jgi:hypothetical protein
MVTQTPQTHGIHQATYDAVFQHPIARNLQWREVKSMLSALADGVQEEQNGNFKFTRNGQTLTVHPPRRKDFSDVQELMQIRHFLEKSAAPQPVPIANGVNLLVVIDHREARVYRTELHGTVPHKIVPYGADDSHRYLHSVTDDSNGQRKPESKAFYEAIAKSLSRAEKILIMGSATGASSAMDHLVEELKKHHAEIAKRVIGTLVVDEKHVTEDQLLAEARAFYASKGL